MLKACVFGEDILPQNDHSHHLDTTIYQPKASRTGCKWQAFSDFSGVLSADAESFDPFFGDKEINEEDLLNFSFPLTSLVYFACCMLGTTLVAQTWFVLH
eukprot:11947443-Ditylum_brightwellii.AAC.1